MAPPWKKGGGHAPPIYITRTEVERVESVKFLGVTITDNLSWASHMDVMQIFLCSVKFQLSSSSVETRTKHINVPWPTQSIENSRFYE
eukprot:g36417.t1